MSDAEILCEVTDGLGTTLAYIFPGLGDAGDRYFGTLPG